MSIKTIDFFFFFVEEALVREVLLCANHYLFYFVAYHALVLDVVDEMNVFQLSVCEEIDVDGIVGEESASDEGVWEGLVAHGVIVDAYKLVDVKFACFDVCFASLDTCVWTAEIWELVESSHIEATIVVVTNGICFTIGRLFDFFHFNVVLFFSTNLL